MQIDSKKLGDVIREFRKSRRMTQVQLAQALEMTSNNLARLERGEIGCSIKTLNALTTALNVPASFLTVMATVSPGTKDPVVAHLLKIIQEGVRILVRAKNRV